MMEGIPNFCVPTILSFLETREACRCACVAKEWVFCAQHRLIQIREESAKVRAQVQHNGSFE